MRIFLSYSSQNLHLAERICLALTGEKHSVFFDRSSLPAAEGYDGRIRGEIQKCDLFVFLISPDSVREKSYALSELTIAQERWAHPARRVLPVMLIETEMELVPAYLRAVSILKIAGDAPADVANAVARLARNRKTAVIKYGIAAAVFVLIAVIAFSFWPAVPNAPDAKTSDVPISPVTRLLHFRALMAIVGDGRCTDQRTTGCTARFGGDGGHGISAQINAPAGIAVDDTGTIFTSLTAAVGQHRSSL